jgi:hypothetical protein
LTSWPSAAHTAPALAARHRNLTIRNCSSRARCDAAMTGSCTMRTGWAQRRRPRPLRLWTIPAHGGREGNFFRFRSEMKLGGAAKRVRRVGDNSFLPETLSKLWFLWLFYLFGQHATWRVGPAWGVGHTQIEWELFLIDFAPYSIDSMDLYMFLERL